ncbi:acyltransferase family protein [Microbacterium ureisolvens]|uniref:Acyltransferase family protein n=1 Tax=Microbacterium ureisolvens TaxID=2781186 RepID=A0ABS7I239_9MICO|nr:acyltransferase family protein [Microbacterium ureisolvens]MBW9111729.1 acyltransferase family protein [Microbacterium ureisolvens]
MPKERSAAIDAIRVLGITAVVAGHVWSGELARDLIYTWQVPVFFFLSGYLWSTGRTLASEARNRWRTLGVPYAFWLVVIGTLYMGWLAYNGQLTIEVPLRILAGGEYIGRPLSAFWFMSALFAACILFRLLDRWPLAIVAVGTAGLIAAGLRPDLVAGIPLSIGVAVPALIFMIAGYALKALRDRIPAPTVLAAAALAVAAVLVATGLSAPLDMKRADFGTAGLSVLVAVMISGGLVVLSETLVPKLGAAPGRALIALASCGTMVILTHAVILWVLDTPADGSLLDFALALVLPWAAALVVARTPLSPLLIGAPRQQRVRQATP